MTDSIGPAALESTLLSLIRVMLLDASIGWADLDLAIPGEKIDVGEELTGVEFPAELRRFYERVGLHGSGTTKTLLPQWFVGLRTFMYPNTHVPSSYDPMREMHRSLYQESAIEKIQNAGYRARSAEAMPEHLVTIAFNDNGPFGVECVGDRRGSVFFSDLVGMRSGWVAPSLVDFFQRLLQLYVDGLVVFDVDLAQWRYDEGRMSAAASQRFGSGANGSIIERVRDGCIGIEEIQPGYEPILGWRWAPPVPNG